MKQIVKNSSSFSLVVLIILASCILVRLPHFLSNDFFFDGDEGIVGIMAQDFLLGKGIPIYFYGQNYGFSTLEVFSTAFFIKLFGSGIWALRLGGLLLFSVGLTFIWKTLNETKTSKVISISVLILLITAPTWILWGGMVRGGYVTAFMCFGIMFYITQVKEANWKWVIISSVIGVCAYEAQPLIFIPLLPFIISWMQIQKISLKSLAVFLGIAIFISLILHYFGANDEVWSAPKSILFDFSQFQNLKVQSEGIIYGYSNFFFFTMNVPIAIWWYVLLIVSLIIIVAFIVYFTLKTTTRNKRVVLLMTLCLMLSVFLISSVSLYSPRYWLGFFTGILFLFCFAVIHSDSRNSRRVVIGIAILYCIGLVASRDMKRDWYFVDQNEMKMISELYEEVNSRNIKAVFVADPVLQWKWNYLYGRSIPGTFFSEKERTNEFRDLAFETLEKTPQATAIIGLYGNYVGLDESEPFKAKVNQIAVKYYIVDEIDKALIEETVLRLK